jgi:lambda repressor-like predicted transcriptional regulator
MAGTTANGRPGRQGHPERPALRTAGLARRNGAGPRPLGATTDGIGYFAPIGEFVADGDFVLCHLCGRWLRSVTAHLRAHGWTKVGYCEAFGLERGQSLEGAATRKLRAAAFSARLIFDPAVRAGSEQGQARARSGELAQAAAAAARGRPLPEQRRRKARLAQARRPHSGSAEANRARAAQHLASVAAVAAARGGYADIGALVRARTAEGVSLAAISREAGLHKDWLSRHLARLDPHAAAVARARKADADDRWLPVLADLGFADVASYLRARHDQEHRTVNQIAAEVGMSYHTVEGALLRHGIARTAHAAKRHAAAARAEQVAAMLGLESVADYVAARRSEGWTWSAMSAETGQPQTWLRRQSHVEVS